MTLTNLHNRVKTHLKARDFNIATARMYLECLDKEHPEVFKIYVSRFRSHCARIESPRNTWTNACLTDVGDYYKLIDESITVWLRTQSGSRPTVPVQSAAAQQPHVQQPAALGQVPVAQLQDLATLVSALRSTLEKLEPALWKIAKQLGATDGTSTCEPTAKQSASADAE